MSNTNTLPKPDRPYVVAEGDGVHTYFLNNLATTKVAAADSALMSVVQFKAPRGFGPPVHVHDDEDEVVVVTEGSVAFRSGDDETIAAAGGIAFLPRAVPHTFQVLSDSATMISITASETGHPRFDTFVSALSTPAAEVAIPPHAEIDGGQVARVGAEHKIGIVGPPPPPLAEIEGDFPLPKDS